MMRDGGKLTWHGCIFVFVYLCDRKLTSQDVCSCSWQGCAKVSPTLPLALVSPQMAASLQKNKVIMIDLDACPTWCNRGRGPLAHGCWSPTHSGGSQQRQPSLPPSWSFSWNRVETKAETFLQSSHDILICDMWNLLTEFSWYVLAPASRSSLHTSDFPGYTELNRI